MPAPSFPGTSESPASSSAQERYRTAKIQSQLAGDAELMKVVASYIEELPCMLNRMLESLQHGDFEELAGLAHNLKGSSGLAGFPNFASQAAKLQENAQEQRTDQIIGIMQSVVELCQMVGAATDNINTEALTGEASQIQTTQDSPEAEQT